MENVPGHPQVGGLSDSLGGLRPEAPDHQGTQMMTSVDCVDCGDYRCLGSQVWPGVSKERPGSPRGSQQSPGTSQERLRNGGAELQKNWKIEL